MFLCLVQVRLTVVRLLRIMPQICRETRFENIFAFSLAGFETVSQLAAGSAQKT